MCGCCRRTLGVLEWPVGVSIQRKHTACRNPRLKYYDSSRQHNNKWSDLLGEDHDRTTEWIQIRLI